MLKKIAQEEKSIFNLHLLLLFPFLYKSLKNKPLSQLTPRSMKRKLDKGKDETPAPLSLFGTLFSPTPSLKMMTSTPPTTHSNGKGKVGKSACEDPSMVLGRAHNVITNDELRGLLSIPSHELVSRYIHKLVRVFYSATFVAY